MSCPSLNRKFNPETGYSTQPTTRRSTHANNANNASATATHNLNLQNYTFDELLDMFDLTYSMTLADLKSAKRKVLMLHPDKSNLPAEYFLFYKRAFENIVQYYENYTKQNVVIDETTPTDYVPIHTSESIRGVESMSRDQFHSRFNELFDQHMAVKPDDSRNAWFRSEQTPEYIPKQPVSVSNLASTFDQIKQHQRQNEMVRYSGVRELAHSSAGTQYYDDQSNEDADTYVSSNPFSKLPFEDLRKVHKDQTVFAVSEQDYEAVPKYRNVEQYSAARNSAPLTPMEKSKAEMLFVQKEQLAKERAARQQYQAEQASREYAERNRVVRGAFLHLEDRELPRR